MPKGSDFYIEEGNDILRGFGAVYLVINIFVLVYAASTFDGYLRNILIILFSFGALVGLFLTFLIRIGCVLFWVSFLLETIIVGAYSLIMGVGLFISLFPNSLFIEDFIYKLTISFLVVIINFLGPFFTIIDWPFIKGDQ